jgi:hypothetical protein
VIEIIDTGNVYKERKSNWAGRVLEMAHAQRLTVAIVVEERAAHTNDMAI